MASEYASAWQLASRGWYTTSSPAVVAAFTADHACSPTTEQRFALNVRSACDAVASFNPPAESCLTSGPEADPVYVTLGGDFISVNAHVLVWPATAFVMGEAKRLAALAFAALLLLADTGAALEICAIAPIPNVEAAKRVRRGFVPVFPLAAFATLVGVLRLALE